MSKIKFEGSEEEFLNKLNKCFNLNVTELIEVNEQKRYSVLHDGTKQHINLYKNSTVLIQPGNDKFNAIVDKALSSTAESNISDKQVFIVHGHDISTKNGLENMLLKWGVKYYIIQDEDSKGKTIIERLEEEINDSSVGIVVLTPDDMGYSKKDGESAQKSRARQNVILELGMLMGKLGRERTIIITKENIERPSDIDGLLYIPYKDYISDTKEQLATRLKNLGFSFKEKD